jgi:hypothetical protein
MYIIYSRNGIPFLMQTAEQQIVEPQKFKLADTSTDGYQQLSEHF